MRSAEPVRYVARSYAPIRYAEPAQSWDRSYDERSYVNYGDYGPSYVPTNYYSPATHDQPSYATYNSGYSGLAGGGNGLIGALLPVLLQGLRGDSGLGGWGGGLGGLSSGLGGYDALSELSGAESPDVYPLQLASYAPYSSDSNTGLGPLLPALLGGG